MAAKFIKWNTEYCTEAGLLHNRGQNVYPCTEAGLVANPPKFEEDLNAEEE